MATYELNNFNFSFMVRRAPKSGPTSSDKWNDTMDELGRDLSNIALEWNTKIVPIIDGLPNGSVDSAINAFANGLDGMNMWVDQNVNASSDDTRYYNGTKARPNTIKEQFDSVYTNIISSVSEIQETITSASSGLTTDQKNAIGAHIFDSGAVSSDSSLDGKSENNRLNIIQIATDMYGDEVSLDNNGSPNLVNSVKAMVDALLQLHNGDWSNDIILSHAGVVAATQSDVSSSAVYNDAYEAGPITTLEHDLNRIRTELRQMRGTGSWTTSNSLLYAGGADSLEDLFTSTAGTGTKSSTNPWGYAFDDIGGLTAVLDAIRDYTGQDDHTDSTPTYASNNFITDGTSLETAIGALDTALIGVPTQLAALEAFTGQDNNIDDSPDYSSTLFITQNGSLEQAIGELDLALNDLQNALTTVSGLITGGTFIDLVDVIPSGYAGYAGYFPRVTGAEDGLDFSNVVMTSDTDTSTMTIEVSGVHVVGGFPGVSVSTSGSLLVGDGGVYLKSPNGTQYLLTVGDDGSLITTAV